MVFLLALLQYNIHNCSGQRRLGSEKLPILYQFHCSHCPTNFNDYFTLESKAHKLISTTHACPRRTTMIRIECINQLSSMPILCTYMLMVPRVLWKSVDPRRRTAPTKNPPCCSVYCTFGFIINRFIISRNYKKGYYIIIPTIKTTFLNCL